MFADFSNVWTPVVLARKLGAGKPLAAVVAGERVVFFRDRDGQPRAMWDVCPHRGVQLSLGTVTPEGCLRCPFHGWEFAADGQASHVPLNPDAKLETLHATPLPVHEGGGLLWLYTAPGTQAPAPPQLPESLTLPGLAATYLEADWAIHWTRAMENMLDMPHVPFVHAGTIGRGDARRLRRESRLDITWEPTPTGGRITGILDGRDEGAWLEFRAPNMMVLNIPIPGKLFRMHAVALPTTPGNVRMLVVGTRNFATLRLLNPFFALANKRIVGEDAAVVQSSHPSEVPPAGVERSVRTDKPTLQFRKYYQDQLKGRDAGPPNAVTRTGNLPVAA